MLLIKNIKIELHIQKPILSNTKKKQMVRIEIWINYACRMAPMKVRKVHTNTCTKLN